MAMIDYGAIVKINGKIVNKNQFFMDMEQSVGWIDYPRIRYDDCDCINDNGCSECYECPRRKTNHHSSTELGEWDETLGDCRGNKLWIDGKLDQNYFAYAGDENFTVAVYKTQAVFTNKDNTLYVHIWYGFYSEELTDKSKWETDRMMVRKFDLAVKDEVVHIKIKRIAESDSQFYMTFRYKGKMYEVVYGYGIDSNKKVWDKVKTRYCTKKGIRFIDKFWLE